MKVDEYVVIVNAFVTLIVLVYTVFFLTGMMRTRGNYRYLKTLET